MRKTATAISLCALVFSLPAFAAHKKSTPAAIPDASTAQPAATQQASDNDQTLRAMHDEMERNRARLQLPGVEKPFYLEYRLLDVDVRAVTASFGNLVSSTTTRNRFMSVDARIGDYHLDSSNFVSEDGFQGFLGSTGEVGIDHDYNSLRQDLWLATDQAYKEAATQLALKQAFLRSLTKPPEIDDFSQERALVKIDPRELPDWTARKWEDEARAASLALKSFPQLYGTRVNYYFVYTTYYLTNSEGTELRTSKSLAAVEAAFDTQADDGMPLHNYYAIYVAKPADVPDPATISKGLTQAGSELVQLRAAPLVPDFTGPVLFDSSATGSVLAQLMAASLSGARSPLSMMSAFDQIMDRMGGRSEWTGRVGTRVLPSTVSLVDDPTIANYQNDPLLGHYEIDDEGVKGQRVELVQNGILKNLLMSRRPGPEFQASNGHARSAMLSDTKPLASNLIFQSSDASSAADLRKKFIEACRQDGHEWCIEIKRMDNPALSSLGQQDFSDFLGSIAGGVASGERIPLLYYRVYVADGREELVRGGHIEGLTLRSLRNMAAIGDDLAVYDYMQNPAAGFAGTALGSFGGAQGGIPSSIVAPSLLLEEVEIRGFHGEPRRLPLVPPPALK
ncbi:MAG TPA: metallopeptidase TldD-related protein [Candidatus Acidoferrales bacterium]|nr:metallopeptidase TldD-related protein [Candidatus Acidoferrales bacterium]